MMHLKRRTYNDYARGHMGVKYSRLYIFSSSRFKFTNEWTLRFNSVPYAQLYFMPLLQIPRSLTLSQSERFISVTSKYQLIFFALCNISKLFMLSESPPVSDPTTLTQYSFWMPFKLTVKNVLRCIFGDNENSPHIFSCIHEWVAYFHSLQVIPWFCF